MNMIRDVRQLHFLAGLPTSSFGYFTLAASRVLLKQKWGYVQILPTASLSTQTENKSSSLACRLP